MYEHYRIILPSIIKLINYFIYKKYYSLSSFLDSVLSLGVDFLAVDFDLVFTSFLDFTFSLLGLVVSSLIPLLFSVLAFSSNAAPRISPSDAPESTEPYSLRACFSSATCKAFIERVTSLLLESTDIILASIFSSTANLSTL